MHLSFIFFGSIPSGFGRYMLLKYLIRAYRGSSRVESTVSSGLEGCVAGVHGPDAIGE